MKTFPVILFGLVFLLGRNAEALSFPDAENELPSERKVTFKVIPAHIPDSAKVYITGNHPQLGEWDAGKVPLIKNTEENWSKTFLFEDGTRLEYKITRGMWKNEALNKVGRVPAYSTLEVKSDTLIIIEVESWKDSKSPDSPPIQMKRSGPEVYKTMPAKNWLKPGAVVGLYHMLVKDSIDQAEHETFLKNEYFSTWSDLVPGSRTYYLKGERGERNGQHVFFWIFDSIDDRNRYYPTKDESTAEYDKLQERVDWLYTDDKFYKYAKPAAWDFNFSTDFVFFAPRDDDRKIWLRPGAVAGMHYLKLKPNADSDKFEKFIVEEWAPARSSSVPQSKFFFLKGERGKMEGQYAGLWVFESKEVRDKYFPKAGEASALYDKIQKRWAGIEEKLNQFIDGWENELQTDYVVVQ